ncbi:MAG: helix-turn-helix transcriptional regulator, partial [Clostridia bacterium]|nr:helix-turn-helix transcriptional regulator [Clostridia bacterium]
MNVPMVNWWTQILTNSAVKMIHKRISKTCAVGERCNVTILICPLVHSKSVNVAAGNIKFVYHICNGRICGRPLVRTNHCERFILFVRHNDTVEHILYHMQSRVHYDFYRISHEIKNRTGKTYTELVQDKRLSQAAYLLKNTNISAEEISEAVGYSNKSYFYRIFTER